MHLQITWYNYTHTRWGNPSLCQPNDVVHLWYVILWCFLSVSNCPFFSLFFSSAFQFIWQLKHREICIQTKFICQHSTYTFDFEVNLGVILNFVGPFNSSYFYWMVYSIENETFFEHSRKNILKLNNGKLQRIQNIYKTNNKSTEVGSMRNRNKKIDWL